MRTHRFASGLALACLLLASFNATAQSGEYGTIPGSFDVNQFGQATYSMPIFTAEGPGGFKPNLSLEYNHGTGDGALGVGWSVGGLSEITRCAQTIAANEVSKGIRYSSDSFCLNGNRLIVVSGTYGSAGSEYRTEIDELNRIVAVGTAGAGPSEFVVTTPDGMRYSYGNANNSSLLTGTTHRMWRLHKVQDRSDNEARFYWEKNDTTGAHRLSSVEYGGTNVYKVVFTYEDKPAAHKRSGFLYGESWDESKRLTAIAVQSYVSGWQTTYTYNLAYLPTTDDPYRSLLKSVQQCGPTQCFNGSYFEWADGQIDSVGFGSASTAAATWTPSSYSVFVGDFNGDGKEDVATKYNIGSLWGQYGLAIYYAAGGTLGTVDLQQWGFCSDYRTIEFDGDGRADLLCIDGWFGTGSPAALHVKQSTPTGWVNYHVGWATWDATYGAFRVQTADVNGDGLTDIINEESASDGWKIKINSGAAFATGTAVGATASSSLNALPLGNWVNTDDDLSLEWVVPRKNNGSYVEELAIYQYTSGPLEEQIVSDFQMVPHLIGVINQVPGLPDINGDGLADLAYKKYGSTAVHTRLNTGNGFAAEIENTGVSSASLPYFARYVDVNNDGLDDLLLQTGSGSTWQAHYSDGSKFVVGSGNLFIDAAIDFADVTGDGNRDAVYRGSGGTTWYIHPHLAELRTVTTFWDGLGNWQKPTYSQLSTMTDHYHWNDLPAVSYPERLFKGAISVVDHYEANTGTGVTDYSYSEGVEGESYIKDFYYYDAKLHNQGRGFLGFIWIRIADSRQTATNVARFRRYRQDFPFIGVLDEQSDWHGYGASTKAITNTDYEWAKVPASDTTAPFIVRMEQSTRTENEVEGTYNGQLIRTVVRNPQYETTYGNVDLETITTTAHSGETYTTSIDYTLQNFTTPWCIGLPDAIAVTKSGYGMASQTRSIDNAFNSSTCRLESTTNTSETSQDYQLRQYFTYDTYGNVKTITLDSADGAAADRKTEFFYDTSGHSGHLPSSQKRYVTGEYDHTVSMSWDYRFATPLSITTPQGETSFDYDQFGRVEREDRPDSSYTTFSYGLCTSCIGSGDGLRFVFEQPSNDVKVTTYYDTYGRRFATQTSSPSAAIAITEQLWRDPLGNVEQRVLPRNSGDTPFSHFYAHDTANRVFYEVSPLSEGQQFAGISTQTFNRLSTTTTVPGSPTDQTTTTAKDALGRVTSVTDSMSGATLYEYNAFDQLTKATDTGGHIATVAYNNRGDRISLTDPDLGSVQFESYDVFGDLTRLKDAKSQTVLFGIDQLGRLDWRSEPEFPGTLSGPEDDDVTDFTYYNTAGSNHGLPKEEIAPDGYEREYDYDSIGRPSVDRVRIDSTTYSTDFSYHSSGSAVGKLGRVTYPTSTSGVRATVDYAYDSAARLSSVSNGATGVSYYKIDSLDALGRPTTAQFNVTSPSTTGTHAGTYVYDRATFLPIVFQAATSSYIQNLYYEFYPNGNLKLREDSVAGRTDEFTYDSLNRLDTQKTNSSSSINLADYSADGNITFKDGVGNYSYGGASGGPHAVTAITGLQSNTYAYDANGNMTNRDGDAITWYSYNLPKKINYGSDSAEFWYGTDRSRYKQVAITGGTSSTTRYIGEHFEVEARGGLTIYRHLVRAGDQIVAQYERRSDGTNDTQYFHRDYQGSVGVTSNTSGLPRQRWEYEPFGTRWRTAGSGADDTERGYTGHEHLDSTALIHMNGRVQDPMLGRFISADPFVPDLYNSQSLNRYSYVQNNPASLIDPSGFDEIIVMGDREYWRWLNMGRDWDWLPTSSGNTHGVFVPGDGVRASSGNAQPIEEVVVTARQQQPKGIEEFVVIGSRGLFSSLASAWSSYREWGERQAAEDRARRRAHYAETFGEAKADFYTEIEEIARGFTGVGGLAKIGSMASRGAGGALRGLGNIGSHSVADAGTALSSAQKWLGAGYREIGPGVFRSADGLRQFRMTNADLLPTHGRIGSHVHFEALNGAGQVIENLHLPVGP